MDSDSKVIGEIIAVGDSIKTAVNFQMLTVISTIAACIVVVGTMGSTIVGSV